jgi:hypothetical protein
MNKNSNSTWHSTNTKNQFDFNKFYTLKFLFIFIISMFLYSCAKEESEIKNDSKQDAKVASVSLIVSKPAGNFWMYESEPLLLKAEVKDSKGLVIPNFKGKIQFLANNKELSSEKYVFDEEGKFNFIAVADGVSSALSGDYIAENPEKLLDEITVANKFYEKYGVLYTLVDSKLQLSVKGKDKTGLEVPVKNNLKISFGGENINLEEYTFTKPGKLKIIASAYGKQKEITFEVRQQRNFELVRIPVIFHFCLPSPYTHPVTKTTNAQNIEKAILQLKSGEKLAQLNAMFRNKFLSNSNELDPNASDSFIEFYLADKDPKGNVLKEIGVNRMNLQRPYVPLTEPYVYNEAQRLYEVALEQQLASWKTTSYLNIVVENFGNFGYAGIAKMSMMDNNRKHLIPNEYNSLPVINMKSEQLAWGSINTRWFNDHVRLNGAQLVLTESEAVDGKLIKNSVLTHEIGHALGLQHTFGLNENCADSYHSDGLHDTPRQISADYFTSCDGVKFFQRNLMNYINVESRGSFTYDQVTMMRARIEASFNLPTPRNKGSNGGRESGVNNGHLFSIVD